MPRSYRTRSLCPVTTEFGFLADGSSGSWRSEDAGSGSSRRDSLRELCVSPRAAALLAMWVSREEADIEADRDAASEDRAQVRHSHLSWNLSVTIEAASCQSWTDVSPACDCIDPVAPGAACSSNKQCFSTLLLWGAPHTYACTIMSGCIRLARAW
jgi:hypothetical protein